MINITFPDGNVRQYEAGASAMDIAKSIRHGLAKNVLSARVNGEVWDSTRPIETDAKLELLTWKDEDGKSTFWHSSAHLMAEALEALYPGTKFGIGPAIEKSSLLWQDFTETRSVLVCSILNRAFSDSISLSTEN